jgi:hypothetical protein
MLFSSSQYAALLPESGDLCNGNLTSSSSGLSTLLLLTVGDLILKLPTSLEMKLASSGSAFGNRGSS